jgi:hypothetical protein
MLHEGQIDSLLILVGIFPNWDSVSALVTLQTVLENDNKVWGNNDSCCRYLPWVFVSPSMLFLTLCWLLPESPAWLMSKGRATSEITIMLKGTISSNVIFDFWVFDKWELSVWQFSSCFLHPEKVKKNGACFCENLYWFCRFCQKPLILSWRGL